MSHTILDLTRLVGEPTAALPAAQADIDAAVDEILGGGMSGEAAFDGAGRNAPKPLVGSSL
ncbi:hypothetical protein [Actinacidiphila glaucinigra]|uniref:hypothetical protein n=1 Tax=Actinacidiphila glaucinigra TaxID=235986 RepID=UPI003D8B91F4